MLRLSVALGFVAATAEAFSPAALPHATRRAAATAPQMQLWQDGKVQGKGVTAIPYAGRPATPAFDGTWVGDAGFDPLVISGSLDMKWLREAELKHCRVAMLAAAGAMAQDVFQFPGASTVYNKADKLTKLHDKAVEKGSMGQILVFITLFEIFGTAAVIQMQQGSGRIPGDFGFDPLGFSKGKDKARMELAEIKNGRLAMLGFSGMIHHYFITGKGPIELITGQ
ncbi:light harvesting protein 5 [Baffinella frigidus]|nr:light harvesting protein 5 [Cryptophyta sp. CCMP2293]